MSTKPSAVEAMRTWTIDELKQEAETCRRGRDNGNDSVRVSASDLESLLRQAASQATALAELQELLQSVRAELVDVDGDDDRLARVLALAKIDDALASPPPRTETQRP